MNGELISRDEVLKILFSQLETSKGDEQEEELLREVICKIENVSLASPVRAVPVLTMEELKTRDPGKLPGTYGENFYVSDNMFGFDGYLVDHKPGEKLPPGRYRVRESGSAEVYWREFKESPKE